MLGYYPNSNAKPRGSNLNKKIQTLISLTFHKHLCWLTYIETSKITNNTYTHLLTLNIGTCIHTYKYTYKHIQTDIYIHTHVYIHNIHTHLYIRA